MKTVCFEPRDALLDRELHGARLAMRGCAGLPTEDLERVSIGLGKGLLIQVQLAPARDWCRYETRRLFLRSTRTVILLILLAVILASFPVSGADQATFALTILHTNDFHGADPFTLVYRAALIKKIRAEEKNVLLLDAGDVWTRGPYGKVFHGELEIAAMNAMGYDAMTLGNNEFKTVDDGLQARAFLRARVHQAAFPCLSANVTLPDGAYLPGVKPYAIKEFDGIRLGILGLTSKKVSWYTQAQGFTVADPVAVAAALLPAAAGEADLVVALTHIGLRSDKRLARKSMGLAAIVGGDSHSTLRKPLMVGGVPIVQAGSGGRYLGRLDLIFALREGRWQLQSARGRLLKIDDNLDEDPQIKAIVDEFLANALKPAA